MPAVPIAKFPSRMNALAKQVKVYKGVVEDVTTRRTVETLVQDTPVDTGEAISNWLVGRGRPRRSIIKPHFPGKGGSTARANRLATVKEASRRVRAGKTRPIWISNNVPHMEFLNRGSSTQAPAGFIQNALVSAQQAVRRTKVFGRAARLSNRLS